VKAYLLRLGSEDTVAEEIAQEAMVTVWRKAATFDPVQASVSTWVFTIARNRRIDGLRRLKRADLDPEDPGLQPQAQPAADRLLYGSQREERLRRALKTLPEEQAEMIRLAFFEDKAHAAIASETDLPLGTVKSRLRLALTRLRRALAAEGIDQV
jgi:RNA polymerase sigma-70 factor (ECF subfamily)